MTLTGDVKFNRPCRVVSSSGSSYDTAVVVVADTAELWAAVDGRPKLVETLEQATLTPLRTRRGALLVEGVEGSWTVQPKRCNCGSPLKGFSPADPAHRAAALV